MRFLVDAQLPPLLCEVLDKKGISAIHVNQLPNSDETSDKEVAIYADESGYIVITKDADFFYSHMLYGVPKKLLLITIGNIKNKQLFDTIRNQAKAIAQLFEQNNFIELHKSGLIVH